MNKNSRTDSDLSQHKIVAAVSNVIQPPANIYLTRQEIVRFHVIVQEYAKSELTPMRLELCALLASTMERHEQELKRLRKEGSVIPNWKGKPIPNPRNGVVERLTGMIVKLRTHILADGKIAAGARKTRAIAKQTESMAEEALNKNRNGAVNLL